MSQYRYGSSGSAESRAYLISTFLTNNPSKFSLRNIHPEITSSRGIGTVIKLNHRRLAWGENRSSSASVLVPYCSVDLGLVKELFSEPEFPNILLCVLGTVNQRDHKYEVVAFRLQDEHEVQIFIDLHSSLVAEGTFEVTTRPRGWVDEGPFQVTTKPRSLAAERVTSKSQIRDEQYSPPANWTYRDRTRHGSRKSNKSASATIPVGNISTVQPHQQVVYGADASEFRPDGILRRKKNYSTVDTVRSRDNRQSFYDDRSQVRHSEVELERRGREQLRRRMSEMELSRSSHRSPDRFFSTRSIGVTADLPLQGYSRSRHSGEWSDLDLSCNLLRIYTSRYGTQVGDVSCQTNLSRPIHSQSARDDSTLSSYNYDSGYIARAQVVKDAESKYNNGDRDGTDWTPSRGIEAVQRNMKRQMTLVDNGTVKVTVEEYQDPSDTVTTPSPFQDGSLSMNSPRVESGSSAVSVGMRNYDRDEIDYNSNSRRKADSNPGLIQKESSLSDDSGLFVRSTDMTSSVRRVFSRPSGHRSASEFGRVVHSSGAGKHPEEFHTKTRGHRHGSYKAGHSTQEDRPTQRRTQAGPRTVYQSSASTVFPEFELDASPYRGRMVEVQNDRGSESEWKVVSPPSNRGSIYRVEQRRPRR